MFTVGRDDSNDIVIADRTISRQQALITFKEDGFYIEDTYSKFGTSIEIQDDIYIAGYAATDKFIEIQAGRTIMNFSSISFADEDVECL